MDSQGGGTRRSHRQTPVDSIGTLCCPAANRTCPGTGCCSAAGRNSPNSPSSWAWPAPRRSTDGVDGPADVVALLQGSREPLDRAVDALAPGGLLYWEVDRRSIRRSVVTPGRALRRIRAAGLTPLAVYSVGPGWSRPSQFLPVDPPGPIAWYLSTSNADRGRVRRAMRRLAGRVVRWPRIASLLVPRFAVVATSGRPPTPCIPAALEPPRSPCLDPHVGDPPDPGRGGRRAVGPLDAACLRRGTVRAGRRREDRPPRGVRRGDPPRARGPRRSAGPVGCRNAVDGPRSDRAHRPRREARARPGGRTRLVGARTNARPASRPRAMDGPRPRRRVVDVARPADEPVAGCAGQSRLVTTCRRATGPLRPCLWATQRRWIACSAASATTRPPSAPSSPSSCAIETWARGTSSSMETPSG